MLERKLATVLFVDLVGSTAFTNQDDPEVVRRRVDAYFESTARCIEQHGGTVIAGNRTDGGARMVVRLPAALVARLT